MNFLRHLFATLAGILAGGLCVALVQTISNFMYQPPAQLDTTKFDQLAAWIEKLPLPAFLIVLASWAAGSLIGTYVARRLGPKVSLIPALATWSFFLVATVSTLFAIPHPTWMWPAGLLIWFLFGIVGMGIGGAKSYAVTTTRHIQAPIEVVFQTLACIENFSKAVPGITRVEFMSEQRSGVGTRFRETRIIHGKEASTELEVSELVENERVRMISDAGGTVWDTVFLVQAQPELVRMTMQMEARPHRFAAKLITPWILGMVQTAVEQDMDSVKTYCETQTGDSTSAESR